MTTSDGASTVDAATRDSFVRLERELGLLLRRARALSAKNAAQLHPDLDPAALGLLALLQDAGPLRASDLVALLGLDKSTVSRQVTGLVDLGLVDRTPDPEDGRAQVLRPSAEGASRLQRIRAARRARLEEDLASWPAEDIARLGDLLERLNETMLVLFTDARRPPAN
jgi:DNA-binding MarR family transcriptional regulator